MLIYPLGLLEGERLSECSDLAQLHFPRLVALANGFGRMQLSERLILESAYKGFQRKPSREELTCWLKEYAEHHLLLVYTADSGNVWGQWCGVPDNALPRYATKKDKESPEPPPGAVESFEAKYANEKRSRALASGDALNVSDNFGNLQKLSESSGTFPPVVVVVDGVVGGVVEKQVHSSPSAPTLVVSDKSDNSQAFLETWNQHRGSLSKVQRLTVSRSRKLETRRREGITLEQFEAAVKLAQRTPFLRGENEKRWKCDFDFLIEDDTNLLKVIEGRYGEPDKPRVEYVEIDATVDHQQWMASQQKGVA